MMEIDNCYKLLDINKQFLTRKQYKTFKGWIESGNIDAFKEGISKIIKLRYNRCRGGKHE